MIAMNSFAARFARLLRSSAIAGSLLVVSTAPAQTVLVEAESFQDHGGWVLDTQFIDIMGSPYLLAHGLGAPVKDASTKVKFPETGKYRVLVRTKDWVARWKAPGQPGKFQLLVDGQPLAETFGTKNAGWAWHDGGTVDITKAEVKLALRDLTGFDGRCDAIVFTKDTAFTPPDDREAFPAWRRELLGLSGKVADSGPYDLVVIGGGYGGMGAAISAARMGCKVALIQNRPVLGGNGSSEIRVWAMGGIRRGLYPNLGEIVEEFMDRAKDSPGTFEEFGDAKKEALVRTEKNISLFLNTHAFAVEMSADKKRLVSVTAFNTVSSEVTRFTGKLFCDATGHATIGALANADLTLREEDHLGMSNMWRWEDMGQPSKFPETPWALDLTMDDFPYPKRGKGEWFWESGFNKHPLHDLEYTRDWNLRAVYGAFNTMKNKDGAKEHANAKLVWVAHIGGTRESRQLLGDVILTREDISTKKPFPDGCVPTTWDIDLHYPREQYATKFPNDPFISKAVFDKAVDRNHGYPVPYRCFYSRNLENLFMAGRNVSVTHEALGTVRVMKTGGMIGEVVGKAASLCVKHACTPRDVYHNYFGELKELMQLKGVSRRDNVNSPFYVPADAKELSPPEVTYLDPKSLPGIVVDDKQAKLEGKWTAGEGLKGFVGEHYLYANKGSGGKARYEFTVPATGRYEVRVSYGAHENRASNAPFEVHSADGVKALRVDQRKAPPLEKGFISLGVHSFTAGIPGAVTVHTADVNGNVHIDAVQVLPVQ
jgi:hypothetical protein